MSRNGFGANAFSGMLFDLDFIKNIQPNCNYIVQLHYKQIKSVKEDSSPSPSDVT